MAPVPKRTMDAAFLNEVANHPEVRPHIGIAAAGPLDFASALEDPANVALTWEHGAFVFAGTDSQRRAELHTFILPEGRGAGVLPAFAEAARFIFTSTPALEVVTKTAGSNRAAALMARRAGFRPIFTREGAWEDKTDLTFYALTLDEWRATDEQALIQGREFHATLERAKAAAGSTLPTHPDDEAHERAAGLACLMAKAGQPRKAVEQYNLWAVFAGYQTIELLSQAPLTIDVGDALITFTPDLEVLKCRVQP